VTAALAVLRFAAFEAAVLAASLRLARRFGTDRWLAVLAIDIAIEASIAQALSFAHLNSQLAYWIAAAALAAYGRWPSEWKWPAAGRMAAVAVALAVPLCAVAFRPVDEIDSANYLHYLIDWMANRETPYSFATYYVAFWELSFLPSWMVTGFDWFFPVVALKGVALLAAAAWQVGRELGVRPAALACTVFGAAAMRHYWLEHSGVATLKNDALHGAGFVMLLLVVLRASRRRLPATDIALFALGVAFSCVKYSGVFTSGLAAAMVVWLARDWRLAWSAPVVLLTTGHYYARSVLQFGNPFYPFALRLGPLRLAGEADLSFTSILYNWRDVRVWKYLFAPAGGVSPAGLLFPLILAGSLVWCAWSITRRREVWGAAFVLCGWLLYFRSVYSASAGHGDLAFLGNSLNSLRYVDGVMAASEVMLAAALGRWALPLAAVNAASRLALVYAHLALPAGWVAIVALAAGLVVWTAGRWAWLVVAAALAVGAPMAVERNRARWTTYWDDLKPALAEVRGPELGAFAINEGSYYAGHVVAAGNPVDARVRAFLPEELAKSGARPRYLAVLVTPGFAWREKYLPGLEALGYRVKVEGANGLVMER
jgi:hypothetical protein